jgi:hypothetical protein
VAQYWASNWKAVNATDITATCNDTIAIADNDLYVVIYYYYDFNLNYDYNYDYDYISSIYSYYHIDLIHDYNIDSIERIRAIRSLEVRATVFFTNKKHAINT